MPAESLNPNLVLIVFAVSSAIGLGAKLYKWFGSKNKSNKELLLIQVRYFACYFSFMAGFNFQGPYVYQRYLDTGIPSDQISTIMSTFNIISALWGFFVGYASEILGHKLLIILSALLLGLSALCRYIGGFWYFILSSALMGVSTASNKVVFEDWLLMQIQVPGIPDSAYATIQENSALINLVISLAMTPISSKISKLYGTSGVFAISASLFAISALTILFLMPSVTSSHKHKPKLGFAGASTAIFHYLKDSSVLSLTLLLDFLFSVFQLLYTPRWLAYHQVDKKELLPLSQISSANQMAIMNGAQIFGALLEGMDPGSSLAFSLSANFASVIGMLVLYWRNKSYVFIFYILAGIVGGIVETAMRMIRGKNYPSDVRSYIMGILRVPTSLTVSLVLFLAKKTDAYLLLKVSSAFLCAAAAASFVMRLVSVPKEVKDTKAAKEQ